MFAALAGDFSVERSQLEVFSTLGFVLRSRSMGGGLSSTLEFRALLVAGTEARLLLK